MVGEIGPRISIFFFITILITYNKKKKTTASDIIDPISDCDQIVQSDLDLQCPQKCIRSSLSAKELKSNHELTRPSPFPAGLAVEL